jgi:hypothetical protein
MRRYLLRPVGAGYVDTLARPGGNATGFVLFDYTLAGKWLELLKQIAPNLARAAVFRDPAVAAGVGQFAVCSHQNLAPGRSLRRRSDSDWLQSYLRRRGRAGRGRALGPDLPSRTGAGRFAAITRASSQGHLLF